MLRPKRTAYPSVGTCSERPSQRASPSSMTSGVSVRETRVATRSPTRRPSGDSGPTSSTMPMSMPPEPVTGFCILPRSRTIASTSSRTAAPSPACFSRSWRKDAASRLSRSTRTRTSSGHSSRRVSSRSRGLRQRSRGRQHPVRADRITCGLDVRHGHPFHEIRSLNRRISRVELALPNVFSYSGTRDAGHTTDTRTRRRPRPPPRPRRTDMRIETALDRSRPDLGGGQPYPYRRTELVEPDWRRFPGWRDVTEAEWASAQWQRAHCVKNVASAARAARRPRRRAVLRRPRARPGRARHDVDAGAAADDEHDGARPRRSAARDR